MSEFLSPPLVHAVQALAEGKASADQQATALQFILKTLCHIDRISYQVGGNTHDTAFLEGQRSVGARLWEVMTLSHDVLTGKQEKARE